MKKASAACLRDMAAFGNAWGALRSVVLGSPVRNRLGRCGVGNQRSRLRGAGMNGTVKISSLLVLLVALSAVEGNEIPTNSIGLLSAGERSDPSKVVQATQKRLRGQFDGWLKRPQEYAKRVVAECAVFPEGEIYPYALPAMAYCNLARNSVRTRAEAAAAVTPLMNSLIAATAKRIRPPGGDLMRLSDYGKQGTFLATLNVALGSYRQLGLGKEYQPLHAHVSRLLYEALEKLDGKPVASYPEYTWYFDTVMAIVSLRLFEQMNHLPPRSETLLKKHLNWRTQYAQDGPSGLPIAHEGGLPRGCDLSMQVCLLAQMDSPRARELYDAFVNHHWADYGVIAGFREWPRGRNLLMTGDIDSGPLFLGIGLTATGVGLGAALAMGDSERISRLTGQLANLPTFVRSLAPGKGQALTLFDGSVPINPEYLTGFLYGDAALFYAVTCNVNRH